MMVGRYLQVRKSIFNRTWGELHTLDLEGGEFGVRDAYAFRKLTKKIFLGNKCSRPGGSQPRRLEETNGIRPPRGEGEEGVRCHDARGG